MLNRTIAVAALLGVAMLAGCGGAAKTQGPPSGSTVTEDQSQLVPVEVRLLQVGGPSNSKPRPIVGGQVQAVYGGHEQRQPVTLTTDASGSAGFDLWPGNYTFDGRENTADHFYCRSTIPSLLVAAYSEGPLLSVTVECIVP